MTSESAQHFETRLKILTDSVHEAENMVFSGKLVTMDGMGTEIEVLFADIDRAEPETQKSITPAISALISALDHLETAISVYKAQKQKEQEQDKT